MLAFVISTFRTSPRDARAPLGDVATVQGRDITAGLPPRLMPLGYRNAYDISDQLLKQLGIDQQILRSSSTSSGARRAVASGSRPATRSAAALFGASVQENGIGEQRASGCCVASPHRPCERSVRERTVLDKLRRADRRLSTTDRSSSRCASQHKLGAVVTFVADTFRSEATRATRSSPLQHQGTRFGNGSPLSACRRRCDRAKTAYRMQHRRAIRDASPSAPAGAGAREPSCEDRRQGRRGREGEGGSVKQARSGVRWADKARRDGAKGGGDLKLLRQGQDGPEFRSSRLRDGLSRRI